MQLKHLDLLRAEFYAGGKWRVANSGKTFDVLDPATGERLASVADAGAAETESAIEAAAAAFPNWKNRTASDRARFLKKWNDLILQNADDLAAIMTAEQGKPLAEAIGEVKYGASFIEWFAEEGKRAYGELIPQHQKDVRLLVMKQAIGVVGAIAPWNFPNAMIARKVAPALAAGCTVVVKPSEETPLSALALAVLAERAGFPEGVFNVVTGQNADEIGKMLCESPLVRKISFTGSTRVGKLLMQRCAASVKKISLELGGNAPFIVFDDADLDKAVEGAIASKYRNAGQTCICANRLFAQSKIHDAFVEKLVTATRSLKIGSGSEAGVSIGPLINRKAVEKVENLLKDALDSGASISMGGARLHRTFFEPTIVSNVRPEMAIFKEEIFGPVAPVLKFETDEEAIRLANSTPYGLAAYFYSRDISRIWRAAEGLDFGMIGVNTSLISSAVAPFGGVKESGIGREGSRHGLDEYLEMKLVCLGL